MKAQTKMIAASLVVIMLALTAVSGVTYSWWSDVDESEISINTGKLEALTGHYVVSGDDNYLYSSQDYENRGVPESISIVSVNSVPDTRNVDVTYLTGEENLSSKPLIYSYMVFFKSSMNAKYMVNVDIPSGITSAVAISSNMGTEDTSDDEILGNGVFKGGAIEADGNEVVHEVSVQIKITHISMGCNDSIEISNIITQENNTESFISVKPGTEIKDIISDPDKNEITLLLGRGEYDILNKQSNVSGKKITFSGTEETVIDCNVGANQHLSGADLIFDGVTIKGAQGKSGANYKGIAHVNSVKYVNCTFDGMQFVYANMAIFDNCTFNSEDEEHAIWTYGANDIMFTGCTFNYGDRAINCYVDSPQDNTKIQSVTFNNCTFEKIGDNASIGAIETNGTYMKSLIVNINGCTFDEAGGHPYYVSEWDSTPNGKYTTIIVDGIIIDNSTIKVS